jgi:lipopolysaccharide export system protein LptA
MTLRYFLFIFFIPFFSFSQSGKKVEINRADKLEGVIRDNQNITKLIGNVEFSQGGVNLLCDSALLFEKENSLKAFGHIKFITSNGASLTGENLLYDGNSGIANLLGKIVLLDKGMELKTSQIQYDTEKELAYYPNHAKIKDGKNTLTSKKGYYYSNSSDFFFKDSVVLINPEYSMFSDTLKYNTITKESNFMGLTLIRSKQNQIVCYAGFYNTLNETARFWNKAQLIGNNGKSIYADSLIYNRKTGLGLGYGHIVIKDTAQKITGFGDLGSYNELKEFAWLTKNAFGFYLLDGDTLWAKSDSIFYQGDSTKLKLKFEFRHHAKFYKSDLSGYSDTLLYQGLDSSLYVFGKPILWIDSSQVVAKHIKLGLKNNKPDSIFLNEKAMISSEAFKENYNQVKGRIIKGKFIDGKLNYLESIGNSQGLYYVQDDNKEWIGANKSIAARLGILFESNKISLIKLLQNPEGKFIPLEQISSEDKYLPDFKWEYSRKPQNLDN